MVDAAQGPVTSLAAAAAKTSGLLGGIPRSPVLTERDIRPRPLRWNLPPFAVYRLARCSDGKKITRPSANGLSRRRGCAICGGARLQRARRQLTGAPSRGEVIRALALATRPAAAQRDTMKKKGKIAEVADSYSARRREQINNK